MSNPQIGYLILSIIYGCMGISLGIAVIYWSFFEKKRGDHI